MILFVNDGVSYSLVIKFSAFYNFEPNLEIETVCFESLKFIPGNHYSLRSVFL